MREEMYPMRPPNAKQATYARSIGHLTMAIAVASTFSLPSLAADEPQESGALQEITVTARRQSESLEKVPAAVQALSAQALAEQQVVTEQDLQMAVPGLLVRNGNSSNQLYFSIRGQALDAYSGTAPTVLTYYNEVQTGGTTSTTLYDLQSVQVLKGPQGTLFGRNATGGAVLYTTTQPGKEFTGYANVTLGNYSQTKYEGAVTLPLADWASLRIAGEYEKRAGYENNVYLDTTAGSLNNKNIRGTLLLSPTDSLENTTTVQYGRQGGYSGALRLTSVNTSCPPSPACTGAQLFPAGVTTGGLYPEKLASYDGILNFLAMQNKQPFFNVYDSADGGHDARLTEVINKTTFAINDQVSIKNIAGYNYVHSQDRTDDVGSPFYLLPIATAGSPRPEGYGTLASQYSDELQLAGKAFGSKLNYIVGAFYSRDIEGQNLPLNIGCGSFAFAGGCAVPGGLRYNYETDEKSKALFFQTTYEVLDGLHVTAGYRHTWEQVDFSYVHDSEPQDTHFLQGVPESSLSEHEPSWTLGIDYQLNPETLIYLTQRGGFRVGGFNGTSTLALPDGGQKIDQFKPEIAKDLELGIKYSGRLFGVLPARLNADVYEERISDAQRVVYSGVSSQTANATRAKVDGFEFDGLLDLTSWLQLGLNYAYTDARFTDGRAPFIAVNAVTGAIEVTDITLGPYGDTPKHSGSVYLRFAKDLPNGWGQIVVRQDAFFQTDFYYTNVAASLPVPAEPNTRIGGYTLANAQITWDEIAGSQVHVSASVKNMLNKEYAVGGIGLSAVVGTDAVMLGMPRMFGVEFGVKF